MSNTDDLLKITDDNEKKDFKKILVYGAIAFLVFVIGVVSFAIYKNTSSNDNAILPPEVEKKEPIFKQIPVEKKEIPIEKETTNPIEKEVINNVATSSNKPEPIQNVSTNNGSNISENEPQKIVKTQPKKLQETKKEAPKINQSQTTKIVKTPTLKEIATNIKVEPKKVEKKVIAKYYIQVAALLKWKKPNKKFLETIKRDGFNYEILETYTTINGKKVKVTKVLIGPFESKEEAKRSLVKVKKFISKSAFIIKVK